VQRQPRYKYQGMALAVPEHRDIRAARATAR